MSEVLDAFTGVDAVYVDEHFVLKSGKHSDRYINPDNILPYPSVLDPIVRMMAEPFVDETNMYLACIGPDFGGNYLARDVARHLSVLSGINVPWIATKKQADGSFIIEPDRGFELRLGVADVLVVEDLLTTGGSVKRMMEAIARQGVDIIGATVAINRGGVTAQDLGVPKLFAAENIDIETDSPGSCRWCAMERPIVEDIGHGADYKRKHPDYKGGYKTLLN